MYCLQNTFDIEMHFHAASSLIKSQSQVNTLLCIDVQCHIFIPNLIKANDGIIRSGYL